jgi:hypothetical protein
VFPPKPFRRRDREAGFTFAPRALGARIYVALPRDMECAPGDREHNGDDGDECGG